MLHPNKNDESFQSLIRAWLKDLLELDAGVIVKVFDINSYDFNEIEPKSGAPMLKPLGQRRLKELYVRDGASFLKEIDKFGFLKGYWQYSYQIPAHPMWFNRDEIIYAMEQPRAMSPYGYARTQAILDIIKSLQYSVLYNRKYFDEAAIPDGALSLLDTNELEMAAFRTYWNNEFKAQPHKTAVINKDVKWQQFNMSNNELQFLETQKWYFNIVISEFGLTPSELGITDDVNKATSATQAELVKRKGIRPFLKLLENFVNQGILTEFQIEGIEYQFIYDDPAEKSARLANWQTEMQMGVKTVNEVRNEMGLEPIEGGDITNSQQNRFSTGQPGQPGQPSAEEDKGEEENPHDGRVEEAQSGDYDQNRKREEGKTDKQPPQFKKKSVAPPNEEEEDEEWRDRVHNPYSDSNRPVGNYKSSTLEMDVDDLVAEHKRLVEILERADKEELAEEAKRQQAELVEYEEDAEKPELEEKAVSPKEVGDLARTIEEKIADDIYRVLVATGMNPKRAANYARQLKSRARIGKNTEPDVEKPGMGHSDHWWEVYHALREEGHSKESAAKITNSRVSKNLKKKDDFSKEEEHWITTHTGQHLLIGGDGKPKEPTDSDKPKKEEAHAPENQQVPLKLQSLVDEYKAKIKPEHKKKVDEAIKAWKDKKDTLHLHRKDGEWTPERKALHQQIFERYGKNAKAARSDNPIAHFLSGSPASGKTTAAQQLFTPVGGNKLLMKDEKGNQFLLLNNDDIKKMLPEWDADGTQASIVHEESSHLHKRLLHSALKRKLNVIVDGTMSNVEKATKLNGEFEQAGYKTSLISVNVKPHIAMERAHKNYTEGKNPRYRDYGLIAQYGISLKKSIPKLRQVFKNRMVINNNASKPVIVRREGELWKK